MSTSLSNLVSNYAEGIHKTKCKHAHDDKKCETRGIKYKDCDSFPEYTNFKDNFIESKCLCYNMSYQNLRKWFFNRYKFSNHDLNNFISLLQKGFSFYEYKNDWKKHYETLWQEKENFYYHLNIEDVINADTRMQKMFKKILK